jgi:K+-transporting ATPase ATPase C chain
MEPAMRSEMRPTLVLLVMLSFVTGVVYPLLVTGVGALFFPHAVSGTLLEREHRLVGSALIGQPFHGRGYFWGRPSATGCFAYNPLASGGSNRGPLDPALRAEVRDRLAALRAASPETGDRIPVDLVTSSASGLDPHVSVAAALVQVERVAQVRRLPVAEVRELVGRCTEGRTFGVLGEPRVNVLLLNLALDELGPGSRPERGGR